MSHYHTRNTMPEKVRIEVANELQKFLAVSVDMALQCKQAHWNVKGPNFIALHELFDKITNDVREYADLIGERIVQLGTVAEGTLQAISKKTQLPTYPLNLATGKSHIEALATSLASYGELIRGMVSRTAEMGDQATSDILTEVLRGTDKWLWMLETHIQSKE
jgi:starvation-inducible DNA-binding protein